MRKYYQAESSRNICVSNETCVVLENIVKERLDILETQFIARICMFDDSSLALFEEDVFCLFRIFQEAFC